MLLPRFRIPWTAAAGCRGRLHRPGLLAEEERGDLVEMMPPDDPLVASLRQPEGVVDPLRGERRVERLRAGADQRVVLPDSHPEKLDLLVRPGRVEEGGIELVRVVRPGAHDDEGAEEV